MLRPISSLQNVFVFRPGRRPVASDAFTSRQQCAGLVQNHKPRHLWLRDADVFWIPNMGHRNVAEFNSYHWTKNHSMLFIDAPVGVGFSYAQDAQGLSSTVQDVADHLYEALQQFLTIFPEMQNRDFYVAAQGFAGNHEYNYI
ncbi:hypothetical protein C0J52_00080 [Blattella germanica]|nr:hypothetical protein C0J52_00080 [Blattella germanica]